MKKTAALGLVLLLSTATGLRAQDEKPKADPVPAETEVPATDDGASSAELPTPEPEPEPDAEPVRGVRYRVELKSGGVLDGVIRAKGVFERRTNSGGYQPANESDPGSGVRVWYPASQDGFVFMPLKAIARIDELGLLSPEDGKSIARAHAAAQRRASSERAAFRADQIAASQADSVDEAAAEGAAAEAEALASVKPRASAPSEDDSVEATYRAGLLLKYPPTRWSPETPAEIERRKVILGLFPSDEEKAFLVVFGDWSRAYDEWLSTNNEDPVADERPKREKRPKRQSPRKRPDVERPETPTWKK